MLLGHFQMSLSDSGTCRVLNGDCLSGLGFAAKGVPDSMFASSPLCDCTFHKPSGLCREDPWTRKCADFAHFQMKGIEHVFLNSVICSCADKGRHARHSPAQPGASPAWIHPVQNSKSSDHKCDQVVVPNAVPLAQRVEDLHVNYVKGCLATKTCILVDVRDDDRSYGTIADAIHVPHTDILRRKTGFVQAWKNWPLVIFHSHFSTHRASTSANHYRHYAPSHQRVAIMRGGFREWKCHNLPVQGGDGSQAAADASAIRWSVLGGDL
jgi:rhodanese-related sulfurtransferase